jgi:hypothetical protein
MVVASVNQEVTPADHHPLFIHHLAARFYIFCVASLHLVSTLTQAQRFLILVLPHCHQRSTKPAIITDKLHGVSFAPAHRQSPSLSSSKTAYNRLRDSINVSHNLDRPASSSHYTVPPASINLEHWGLSKSDNQSQYYTISHADLAPSCLVIQHPNQTPPQL